jgi:antitoxin component of MazEF toxin-antitoxin module
LKLIRTSPGHLASDITPVITPQYEGGLVACPLLTTLSYIRYNRIYKNKKEEISLMTTIRRWGNSAAVRIPRSILSQAKLEEGIDVEILLAKEGEITLRAMRKRKSIQELFADYDGEPFQTKEIDWGAPQGNEIW